MATHSGHGRFLTTDGEPIADVEYAYQIDLRHRVWKGTARRLDESGPLPVPAGPAMIETEAGQTGPVHYFHRNDEIGSVIVFTGRGAPPEE